LYGSSSCETAATQNCGHTKGILLTSLVGAQCWRGRQVSAVLSDGVEAYKELQVHWPDVPWPAHVSIRHVVLMNVHVLLWPPRSEFAALPCQCQARIAILLKTRINCLIFCFNLLKLYSKSFYFVFELLDHPNYRHYPQKNSVVI
jgi:hypothetical protein